MPARDLVSVIEAAYRTDGDDAAWLSRILDEVQRSATRGLGCCGYFLDASNLASVRMHGLDRTRLTIDLDPRTFTNATAAEMEPYYASDPAGTGSGQVGGARPWRRSTLYNKYYRPAGAEDIIGIIALDVRRQGCIVGIPCGKVTRLSPRETLALSRIAAHIATGHRLRAGLPAGASVDAGAEAVLDAQGKPVHAVGAARSLGAREALRKLALGIERARTKLRRSDVNEALAVWTALVEGRWSLLDHFDTDGRRYLVARRNDPQLPVPTALTLRERQVLAYTALGHSGKIVSYELGLRPAAVSQQLKSAMQKLGIGSRTEIPVVLGRLVEEAMRASGRDAKSVST